MSSIRYPEELPVAARRNEIRAALEAHQVIVVCGETGSGKTTQLPKICLEAGRGLRGRIGHTQPRRIAARSVAQRIADELGVKLGEEVGYKVRFADHTGQSTRIKLMTDGILLAEMQGDRELREYDTLLIDEAHERSLNVDFLLGFLRLLLPMRPDLKLIITSATIDPDRFGRHFDAPVIRVEGRSFPVEVRYRPPHPQQGEDPARAIVAAVNELAAGDRLAGDGLIFLSGEREIHDTAIALARHGPRGVDILPLYARLTATRQDRVFRSGGRPRIVLATNVAETSLTVPGIRYVIDPGYARLSRDSYRNKLQRLPIEKISRASADQRAGRCGRVQAGICVRLYDEADYLSRPEFTDPAILRTNLASVILQMSSLGLGEVADFPFLDQPGSRYVNDGYRLLIELEAVDAERHITPLGRRMTRLSADPRFARMLIAAGEFHCVREVLVLASALSIRDPRERPLDERVAADERHTAFADRKSDFIGLLNIWLAFQVRRRDPERRLRSWCRQNFLSFTRMREWQDIYRQLAAEARMLHLPIDNEAASHEAIHCALLSGLLGHIGARNEEGDYLGPRSRRLYIFPGSALAGRKPRWIVATSLVETSRPFAMTVAQVKPAWIEAAAGHLLRRTYYDPHWTAATALRRISSTMRQLHAA